MRNIILALILCTNLLGTIRMVVANDVESVVEPVYVNAWDMQFVFISPGTIIMGSDSPREELMFDNPLHRETIRKGFQIMNTEVTQGQWAAVMDTNASFFSLCGKNCPVENITLAEIQRFIAKLNQLDTSGIYRLPTESEWEYACRAGTLSELYWGDAPLCEKANYGYDTNFSCDGCEGIETCFTVNPGHPVPVKSYPPNGWGLYDMIGNVSEICLNSKSPSSNDHLLWTRGGAYSSNGMRLSCGRHGRFAEDHHSQFTGFRLVRVGYAGYKDEPKFNFKDYRAAVKEQEKILVDLKERDHKKTTIFNLVRENRAHHLTEALDADQSLLNCQDRLGNTPLIYAVYKGYEDIVRELLLRGADPNIQGNLDNSALHIAAKLSHFSIANALISAGASLHSQNSPINDRTIGIGVSGTPLHVAIKKGSLEMSRMFIENGADINTPNFKGNSAIHTAAKKHSLRIFEMLLDRGADFTKKNRDGLTAVQVALDFGQRPQIEKIFAVRDIVFPDTEIRMGELTYLFINVHGNKRAASMQKAREMIKAHPDLVHQHNARQKTPLHLAATFGLDEIIPLLIEKGANVNAVDDLGQTPIHKVYDVTVARQLVEAGANVNHRDITGYLPLGKAATRNAPDLIAVLIEGGADIEAVDPQGLTALQVAKKLRFDKVVQILAQSQLILKNK